ncbi:MAG TPA: indolepyruvate oxidoreductase subunit beta [Clostridia bacterium]|nr:indolepyruvate oxidoreductase subunit beta [Clostridia bacterium]
MKKIDILIVGVGGQGTLLSSRILGKLAMDAGLDVKLSEVHGMAQRGGSVVTHVRIGQNVQSPVIDMGKADMIIAFEELEALRWAHYLKDFGKIIVNLQQIKPMPVIMGACKYPQDILERLAKKYDVVAVDALALAKKAGSIKCVNTVLLGVAAKVLGMDKAAWLAAVKDTVPPKTAEVNISAFEVGYDFIK